MCVCRNNTTRHFRGRRRRKKSRYDLREGLSKTWQATIKENNTALSAGGVVTAYISRLDILSRLFTRDLFFFPPSLLLSIPFISHLFFLHIKQLLETKKKLNKLLKYWLVYLDLLFILNTKLFYHNKNIILNNCTLLIHLSEPFHKTLINFSNGIYLKNSFKYMCFVLF